MYYIKKYDLYTSNIDKNYDITNIFNKLRFKSYFISDFYLFTSKKTQLHTIINFVHKKKNQKKTPTYLVGKRTCGAKKSSGKLILSAILQHF